jgi:hypothetical protein
MNSPFRHCAIRWLIILAMLIMGSGCRSKPADSPPAVVQTVMPSVPAATLPSQDTPQPSPTVAPSKVVLLTLPGADPQLAANLQTVLAELTAQDGLTLDVRTQLTGLDLEPEVGMLVAVPPDPGILNLAAANPQVQFLAVGIPGLQAAQNLSVIGSGSERADQQGFLAGYLAATITPDWRVGVISRADTSAGKAARNGFTNGVIFFCGLCRPAFPPFIQYPIFVDLPGGATPADQQAAIDTLVNNAVNTVYVFPGAGDNTLLEGLAAAGLNIIGGATPPASLTGDWVASIRLDVSAAVRQAWPRLSAGEEAVNLNVPIAITDQNLALLSAGRQRIVQSLLDDLLAGFIDTGVNPETGDRR